MGKINDKDPKKRRPGGGRNKQNSLALVLMGKGVYQALKPIGGPSRKARGA